jgi:hypothetical protein
VVETSHDVARHRGHLRRHLVAVEQRLDARGVKLEQRVDACGGDRLRRLQFDDRAIIGRVISACILYAPRSGDGRIDIFETERGLRHTVDLSHLKSPSLLVVRAVSELPLRFGSRHLLTPREYDYYTSGINRRFDDADK